MAFLQFFQQVQVLSLNGQIKAGRGLVGDEESGRTRRWPWRPPRAGACLRRADRETRAGARPARGCARRPAGLRLAPRGRARAARDTSPRGSRICIPMENTGLSELMGSCRIIATLGGRGCRCISGSDLARRSSAVQQHLRRRRMRAAGRGTRRTRAEARHALAGARFADEPQGLALADGEGHTIHGLHGAPARHDVGPEVAHLEDRGALIIWRAKMSLRAGGAGVQGVAQPVPEEVEGQHHEEDRATRAGTTPTRRSSRTRAPPRSSIPRPAWAGECRAEERE